MTIIEDDIRQIGIVVVELQVRDFVRAKNSDTLFPDTFSQDPLCYMLRYHESVRELGVARQGGVEVDSLVESKAVPEPASDGLDT